VLECELNKETNEWKVASRQLDDIKNSAEKIVQLVCLVKIGSESL